MTTIPAPFVTAVRHLLATGWERVGPIGAAPSLRLRGRPYHLVGWDGPAIHARTGLYRTVDFEARSLTEAIDLLVAVGVLPPSMSSAYAAGWAARDTPPLMHAAMQRRVAEAVLTS